MSLNSTDEQYKIKTSNYSGTVTPVNLGKFRGLKNRFRFDTTIHNFEEVLELSRK